MRADRPIGVFDSGIGGLSVLRHIRERLPDEELIYVADSGYAPYGARSAQEIEWRSLEITRFLQGQGVKAVVVACNTATAAAVDRLRQAFSLPIIAMEPAIKPAAALTRSGVVGVLATAGTLGSPRYTALIDRHGGHLQVVQRICHEWVALVESGDISSPYAAGLVAAEVDPLLHAGADVLVLGCTHFPFLRTLIEQRTAGRAQVIDPAPAVAGQLQRRLQSAGLLRSSHGTGSLRFWTSGDCATQSRLIERVTDLRLDDACRSLGSLQLEHAGEPVDACGLLDASLSG